MELSEPKWTKSGKDVQQPLMGYRFVLHFKSIAAILNDDNLKMSRVNNAVKINDF